MNFALRRISQYGSSLARMRRGAKQAVRERRDVPRALEEAARRPTGHPPRECEVADRLSEAGLQQFPSFGQFALDGARLVRRRLERAMGGRQQRPQPLLPPRLVEERHAAVRRHVIGRAPGDGRVGQEPDAVRQARAADVERGAQRGRLEEPGSALDRDDRAVQHRFARERRGDEPDGLRRAELRDVRQRVGLHVDGARRLQRLQLDPGHERRLRRVLAPGAGDPIVQGRP